MGSLKWTREGGSSGPLQRHTSQQHHRQPSLNRGNLTWTRQPGSQQAQQASGSPGSEPLWPSDEPASPVTAQSLQPPLKRQKLAGAGPVFIPTQHPNVSPARAQMSQSLPGVQTAAASNVPSRPPLAMQAQTAVHDHTNDRTAGSKAQRTAPSTSASMHSCSTASVQHQAHSNGHALSSGPSCANGLPHTHAEGLLTSHRNLANSSSSNPQTSVQQQQQQQQGGDWPKDGEGQHAFSDRAPSASADGSHQQQQQQQQQGIDSTTGPAAAEQAQKEREQAAAAAALARKAAAAARARHKQAELQVLRQHIAAAQQRVAQKQVSRHISTANDRLHTSCALFCMARFTCRHAGCCPYRGDTLSRA